MAVFADPTSVRRSLAAVFCWASGWAKGDSRTGSMGSIGVIRCNNTHNFGSSTSRTLRKLGPLSVKGNCKEKKQNVFEPSRMSQNSVKKGKMLSSELNAFEGFKGNQNLIDCPVFCTVSNIEKGVT